MLVSKSVDLQEGGIFFLGEKVTEKFRAAIPKANSEKSFFSSSGNENLQHMLMN